MATALQILLSSCEHESWILPKWHQCIYRSPHTCIMPREVHADRIRYDEIKSRHCGYAMCTLLDMDLALVSRVLLSSCVSRSVFASEPKLCAPIFTSTRSSVPLILSTSRSWHVGTLGPDFWFSVSACAPTGPLVRWTPLCGPKDDIQVCVTGLEKKNELCKAGCFTTNVVFKWLH